MDSHGNVDCSVISRVARACGCRNFSAGDWRTQANATAARRRTLCVNIHRILRSWATIAIIADAISVNVDQSWQALSSGTTICVLHHKIVFSLASGEDIVVIVVVDNATVVRASGKIAIARVVVESAQIVCHRVAVTLWLRIAHGILVGGRDTNSITVVISLCMVPVTMRVRNEKTKQQCK